VNEKIKIFLFCSSIQAKRYTYNPVIVALADLQLYWDNNNVLQS